MEIIIFNMLFPSFCVLLLSIVLIVLLKNKPNKYLRILLVFSVCYLGLNITFFMLSKVRLNISMGYEYMNYLYNLVRNVNLVIVGGMVMVGIFLLAKEKRKKKIIKEIECMRIKEM